MDVIVRAEDRKRIWQMRLVNLLNGMTGATVAFNVLFLQTKGLNPETVGVVMGVNAAIGALSQPLWGVVADRIRSKYRVFVYTALGACLASVLIPISASIRIGAAMLATALIPLLNFFRMPNQAMLEATSVSASAMVPGLDYSDVRMWMSIGFTVMNFAYSPIVAMFGVGVPYYAMFVFTVLQLMCRKMLKPYETDTAADQAAPDETQKSLGFSRLFKNYYLMVFLAINILIQIPQNSAQMMPYLLTEVGADTSMVGIITGARVTAEIVVLMMSFRIKRVLSRPMMMVMAAICFSTEMLLYQIVSGFTAVAFAAMFGGAGFGFVLSTGYNYVNDLAPDGLKATAISLYSMGMPAAGVLTNFLGGQVIAKQGIRMLYLYSAGCAMLWLVIFFASYAIGEKVLKRKAPMPLFRQA